MTGPAFTVRPQPTAEQQAAAAAHVDWDRPVGYEHAASILQTLDAAKAAS